MSLASSLDPPIVNASINTTGVNTAQVTEHDANKAVLVNLNRGCNNAMQNNHKRERAQNWKH